MKEERALSSLQHPLVKHFVKLRTDSSYRNENKLLMIEGIKPIQELFSSIVKLLYTPTFEQEAARLPGEKWQITEGILKKISGMTSPEGIIAEIMMPRFVSLGKEKRVLAFDAISDPGNMGTLLRTALALGWEAVFFLPGCCDPFNEKVLRSARGAHFKLKLVKGTAKDLQFWIEQQNVQALVADLSGQPPVELPANESCLLVLGNEAHGASESVRHFCQPITIPMPGQMESLNVAIAGGILLYLLKG